MNLLETLNLIQVFNNWRGIVCNSLLLLIYTFVNKGRPQRERDHSKVETGMLSSAELKKVLIS